MESASPGLKPEAERTARTRQDQFWIERLQEQPIDAFFQDWYSQPLFNTIDRTTDRFEEMMERRRSHDPAALALSLEHMGTGVMPSLWDSLPGIAVPLLFVAGERDKKYCALAQEMAHLCPHAQAAIITDAGHNTHFERPEVFSEVVAQFLKQDS